MLSIYTSSDAKEKMPSDNKKSNEILKAKSFNDWIMIFYEECGREINLAYSTLNQTNNWAIVIFIASISAIVAIFNNNSSNNQITYRINIPILVISILIFSLNIRFFIRAVLCYINLKRWNLFQCSAPLKLDRWDN